MLRTVLTTLHFLISIGLIASILLQSGRSAGLGAISGGAETFFGKKKGLDDLFGKLTIGFAAAFMAFALILTIVD